MTENNNGRGDILWEKDGDFNPGWLLVAVFAMLGIVASVVGLYITLQNTNLGLAMIPSVLLYSMFGMISAYTTVVSLGRAKLLHSSSVLSSISNGIVNKSSTETTISTSEVSSMSAESGTGDSDMSQQKG